MALDFVKRPQRAISRLGVLPGTFNPPTRAHLALAQAALEHCDEILFVLPRALPHKDYDGVSFYERWRLLEAAVAAYPRFAAAASGGGLFLEIAAECREAYGREVEIAFLCGRDAAERIVGWNYEREEMLAEMFEQFSLLVARRGGEYVAPDIWRRGFGAWISRKVGMGCRRRRFGRGLPQGWISGTWCPLPSMRRYCGCMTGSEVLNFLGRG